MAKFNVERVQGYTIMSNYHLRDNRLSMKAKGLMSVMLSLPPEWDYSLRGLTAICRECQSSIAAMVRELEECGYIERYQERGADGKLGGCVYNIYEEPKTGLPSAEKPCTEKQHTVKPKMEKPCAEKQAVVTRKFFKHFLLIGDAVALALQLVVLAQTLVEGSEFELTHKVTSFGCLCNLYFQY